MIKKIEHIGIAIDNVDSSVAIFDKLLNTISKGFLMKNDKLCASEIGLNLQKKTEPKQSLEI